MSDDRITRLPGVAPHETPHLGRELERRHLDALLRELDHGETSHEAGNTSNDILRYREGDGTGGPPDTDGAWCATVQSYCWIVAAAEMRVRLPFRTSRGAKALTERIGVGGRFILPPKVAPPAWEVISTRLLRGCTIATTRAGGGHVMTFDRLDDDGREAPIILEGNKNNRGPRGARYAVVGPRLVQYVALRPILHAISTLQP